MRVQSRARRIAAKARESRINLRVVDADTLGISFDETTTKQELKLIWRAFASDADEHLDIGVIDEAIVENICVRR